MRASPYPAMPALLPLGELVAPFNSASRSAIRPSVSDADGDAGSGSETAMIMRGALIFVSIPQYSVVSPTAARSTSGVGLHNKRC